jgi:hypothetical protein
VQSGNKREGGNDYFAFEIQGAEAELESDGGVGTSYDMELG